jgi:hypothetical protein
VTSEFQVIVNEGASVNDTATYYTQDKPEIVEHDGEKFVRFVPRNGIINRVGKVNEVPYSRLVAIVTVEEIALDESTQG